MARTITLKYEAQCADCGAPLIAGDRARYYGRGKVYGVDCHTKSESAERNFERPVNGNGRAGDALWTGVRELSRLDPTGFYNAAGELMGRQNAQGRCEDAPCCGCCT